MIYFASCSNDKCQWKGETDDFAGHCPECGAPLVIGDLKDTSTDD